MSISESKKKHSVRNGKRKMEFTSYSVDVMGQNMYTIFHLCCFCKKKKKTHKICLAFCKFHWIFATVLAFYSFIYFVLSTAIYVFVTYPMSGLALARSWPFVQVSVTLLSVTFTMRGVPGIDGNVLGSGVRCKFTLPLFSTCKKQQRMATIPVILIEQKDDKLTQQQ